MGRQISIDNAHHLNRQLRIAGKQKTQLKKGSGLINWRVLRKREAELIGKLGFDIPPTELVSNLSVTHQQIVEIAKALSKNSKVIVFDEPSAVLASRDVEHLLDIIRKLQMNGVGVVHISHRLDEIFVIFDPISVLKDGRNVSTVTLRDVDVNRLIRLMVGRPLSKLFGDQIDKKLGDKIL